MIFLICAIYIACWFLCGIMLQMNCTRRQWGWAGAWVGMTLYSAYSFVQMLESLYHEGVSP